MVIEYANKTPYKDVNHLVTWKPQIACRIFSGDLIEIYDMSQYNDNMSVILLFNKHYHCNLYLSDFIEYT